MKFIMRSERVCRRFFVLIMGLQPITFSFTLPQNRMPGNKNSEQKKASEMQTLLVTHRQELQSFQRSSKVTNQR